MNSAFANSFPAPNIPQRIETRFQMNRTTSHLVLPLLPRRGPEANHESRVDSISPASRSLLIGPPSPGDSLHCQEDATLEISNLAHGHVIMELNPQNQPSLDDEWLHHPPHDHFEHAARRDAVRHIIARQRSVRRRLTVGLLLAAPMVPPIIAGLSRAWR